jgi:hypothetical protein
MDSKDRAALIRKGNELFNGGNVAKAIEIFEKTGYGDGLLRVADYYYFDKKMPLVAVRYYRLAGAKDRVDEIYARMIMALGQWLGKGGEKPSLRVELPPLKVSPKLKILAEEILSRSAGKK